MAPSPSAVWPLWPRSTTRRTRPRTGQPSKGVQAQRCASSGGADLPVGVGVDLDPGLGLLGQAEDAPRVGLHARDQVVQGQAALVYRGQQQRQGGLQAGEPGGGLGPSFSARVCGAWSVAKQSITSRLSHKACAVGGGRQARAHLAPPGPSAGCRRWLRNRWCGATSQVTLSPSPWPRGSAGSLRAARRAPGAPGGRRAPPAGSPPPGCGFRHAPRWADARGQAAKCAIHRVMSSRRSGP